MRKRMGIVGGVTTVLLMGIAATVWAQLPTETDRIASLERRLDSMAVLQQRLERMERLLTLMRADQVKAKNTLVGRWQKVRDDGQHIYIVDSQTGQVKVIGTNAGSVRVLSEN